jgi:hypothetical protein
MALDFSGVCGQRGNVAIDQAKITHLIDDERLSCRNRNEDIQRRFCHQHADLDSAGLANYVRHVKI